jgi:hypothetical protein
MRFCLCAAWPATDGTESVLSKSCVAVLACPVDGPSASRPAYLELGKIMELNEEFRALASAALTLTSHVLAGLNGEQAAAVELAVHGGARLELVFGPLPNFESAAVYLVEHEGARRRLGSFDRVGGAFATH